MPISLSLLNRFFHWSLVQDKSGLSQTQLFGKAFGRAAISVCGIQPMSGLIKSELLVAKTDFVNSLLRILSRFKVKISKKMQSALGPICL